jgi:hypothetical protein
MESVVWDDSRDVSLMRGKLEEAPNRGEKVSMAGEAFLDAEATEGAVLPYVTARQSRLRQLRLSEFDDVTEAFIARVRYE